MSDSKDKGMNSDAGFFDGAAGALSPDFRPDSVPVAEKMRTFSITERLGIAPSEYADEKRKTLLEHALERRNQGGGIPPLEAARQADAFEIEKNETAEELARSIERTQLLTQQRIDTAARARAEALRREAMEALLLEREAALEQREIELQIQIDWRVEQTQQAEQSIQAQIEAEKRKHQADIEVRRSRIETERESTLALLEQRAQEELAANQESSRLAVLAAQQRIEIARIARATAKQRIEAEHDLKAKEESVLRGEQKLQQRIDERIELSKVAASLLQERIAQETATADIINKNIALEKDAISRLEARRAEMKDSALLEAELHARESEVEQRERDLQDKIAQRIEAAKKAEESVQALIDAELLQIQAEQDIREKHQEKIERVNQYAEKLERPAALQIARSLDDRRKSPVNWGNEWRDEPPLRSFKGAAFAGWALAIILLTLWLFQSNQHEKLSAPLVAGTPPAHEPVAQQVPSTIAVSDNVQGLKLTMELSPLK